MKRLIRKSGRPGASPGLGLPLRGPNPRPRSMQINLERKNACRLYAALGQLLWLHSAVNAAKDDEQRLEALDVALSNLDAEMSIRTLSMIQDEVYCSLTEPAAR